MKMTTARDDAILAAAAAYRAAHDAMIAHLESKKTSLVDASEPDAQRWRRIRLDLTDAASAARSHLLAVCLK